MNIDIIGATVNMMYLYLKSAPELKDISSVQAYQTKLKPTPLSKTIITVGLDNFHIGEIIVPPPDTTPPPAQQRNIEYDIKLGFFVPYVQGTAGCLKILQTVMSVLLDEQALVQFSTCRTTRVRYVRDVDGLTFNLYFSYKQII